LKGGSICGKCGKESETENGCVSPIDEHGNHLERVPLCYECLTLWGHAYKSVCKKDDGDSAKFLKNWAYQWKRFMRGYYDKEEVAFT
jgi:hypothetical protein